MTARKSLIGLLCIGLMMQPVLATAQEIHSACALNVIHALDDPDDPNTNQTKGAVHETIPQAALSVAAERHEPKAVAMVNVPLYANEYQAVFGITRGLTAAEWAEILRARKQFWNSGTNGFWNVKDIEGPATEEGFINFLKQEHSTFIVITGHNQKGYFKFRDGHSLSLLIMSKRCGEIHKVCIFVSCRSKDYLTDGSVGVSRDLKLDEGIWLAGRIATWIDSQHQPVSVIDVRNFFAKADREANVRYHVSYIVLAGCGAAAVGAPVVYFLVEGAEG
jgi:hypothetical protein